MEESPPTDDEKTQYLFKFRSIKYNYNWLEIPEQEELSIVPLIVLKEYYKSILQQVHDVEEKNKRIIAERTFEILDRLMLNLENQK